MDWIDLARIVAQHRALVYVVINLWVPENIRKFLSIRTIGGFSGRAQLHEVSY
jgi:hypothetical protein